MTKDLEPKGLLASSRPEAQGKESSFSEEKEAKRLLFPVMGRACGIIALLNAVPSPLIAHAQTPGDACRKSTAVIGACFDVHGKLSLFNGTPGFRIWQTGTTHLFGVWDSAGEDSEGPERLLPAKVWQALQQDTMNGAIFGDYTLCPLSKARKLAMQFVCIANVKHMRFERAAPVTTDPPP